MVRKFDASYDWSGFQISKQVAQGRSSVLDYHRHIQRTNRLYEPKNILINFISNHDENSWNGTIKENFGAANHAFMAMNFTLPGMPLIYSGQEYDLDHRLLFFEKDQIPHTKKTMWPLLEKLGQLKNSSPALNGGKSAPVKDTSIGSSHLSSIAHESRRRTLNPRLPQPSAAEPMA